MGERSDGVKQAHEAWAKGADGHVPSFRFGNIRDAREIAKNSGRPVEEFLSPEESDRLQDDDPSDERWLWYGPGGAPTPSEDSLE